MVEGHSNLNSGQRQLRYANEATVSGMHRVLTPSQWALLRILAVADRQKIDPANMLEGLADEVRGKNQTRILELAERIGPDCSSIDALLMTPELLPRSAMVTMELAQREGEISELFGVILDRYVEQEDSDQDDSGNLAPMLIRTGIYMFFVFILLVFILTKVVPEHLKMYEEFGIEGTMAWKRFLHTSDLAVKLWFVFALLLIASVALFWPVFMRYLRRFRPSKWRQKVYSRPVERRYVLALAALTTRTPGTVLSWIASQASLRGLFPASNLDEGDNKKLGLGVELEGAKLLTTSETNALKMASNGDVQAWLLRWSAANLQGRQDKRTSIMVRSFVVLVYICLAFIVGFTCYALFGAYVNLVERL